MGGGATYKHDVMQLLDEATKAGFASLNTRQQWGLRPCAAQMRCTVATPSPTAFAIARTVQWVASCGGGACVRRTTSAVLAAFQSATIAARRRLSAAETAMEIPMRIMQIRTNAIRRESLIGLFRLGQSTSCLRLYGSVDQSSCRHKLKATF
mgnify:CR=1 FL=1